MNPYLAHKFKNGNKKSDLNIEHKNEGRSDFKSKFSDKFVCYSLDLEEDFAGYLKDHYEGLEKLEYLLEMFRKYRIKVVFFIQGKLIDLFPEKIELIMSNKYEIHLHSHMHSTYNLCEKAYIVKDLIKSKEVFKEFFGYEPVGYRFPFGVVSLDLYQILKKYGFKFDSSIFPTFRPKFYCNLNQPRIPHNIGSMIEIPISVISKFIRIPISLSYIKLFYPLHFFISYKISPIIFNFHIHDIFNLPSVRKLKVFRRFPYMRKIKNGLQIFLDFHNKLVKEGYSQISMNEIYEKIKLS